jgi:hypothetical protein
LSRQGSAVSGRLWIKLLNPKPTLAAGADNASGTHQGRGARFARTGGLPLGSFSRELPVHNLKGLLDIEIPIQVLAESVPTARNVARIELWYRLSCSKSPKTAVCQGVVDGGARAAGTTATRTAVIGL